jgi:xanthosine utilization system XapX-like protein
VANRIVAGLAAGAAGTLALNVAGYLDMLVRGRSASTLPGDVAGRLADEIGLPLDFDLEMDSGEGAGRGGDDDDSDDDRDVDQRVANRQEALGALLGYSNGLGIGVAYGLVRLVMPRPPAWLAGALLGGLAMAASDYPSTRLGLTDPQTWSSADWLADIVPHMAFGVVTAATFEAIKK